jgi:hypothetical protein
MNATPQLNEAAEGGCFPVPSSLSTWWRRYRVVRDGYAGYEAQVWRIWLPIWLQIGFTNTSPSIERAVKICEDHAQPVVRHV